MTLNKQQALTILMKQSKEASFMANVLLSQPQYKGSAAKYLKYMACLASAGFNVRLMPYSIDIPCVEYQPLSWEQVNIIGKSFYKGYITATNVREILKSLARKE